MRGIEWECDPRHVQILVREVLGTSTNIAGKVTTPGVRDKPESLDEDDVLLEGAEAITRYRSLCMRMAYFAQDRAGLGVPCRELAKGMSAPTERHLLQLKTRSAVLAIESALSTSVCSTGQSIRDARMV